MTLLVAGTVPTGVGELYQGEVIWNGDGEVLVGGHALPACQGTGAMLMAAVAASEYAGMPAPHAVLGGDVGRGEGTRAVFSALPVLVDELGPSVVAFHYLQPVMALMRATVAALEPHVEGGPRLVADAGGMYAVRASGVGGRFALMTPDVGEVGFLADEHATHPAYVSRYLFGVNGFDPVALARQAQENGATAHVLLVKGETDHIVEDGVVRGTVSEPDVPELEAIGGTGDTITGLAAALMAAGWSTVDAAIVAARANREAGRAARVRPDTRPSELAALFRPALAEAASATLDAAGAGPN